MSLLRENGDVSWRSSARVLAWAMPVHLLHIGLFYLRQAYPFWADPARDVLAPLRMLHGQVLYQDFSYPYPALAPAFNALLFRLSPVPAVQTLWIACALNYLLIGLLLERLASRWLGCAERALLQLWYLAIPFTPIGGIGPILSPYASSYAYGITLSLGALLMFIRGRGAAFGLLLALTVHCRVDFWPLAAVLGGLAFFAPGWRDSRKAWMIPGLLALAAPFALFCLHGIPVGDWLAGYLPVRQVSSMNNLPLWTAVDPHRAITAALSVLAAATLLCWLLPTTKPLRALRILSVIVWTGLLIRNREGLPLRLVHGQWALATLGFTAACLLAGGSAWVTWAIALTALACWARFCVALSAFPLTWFLHPIHPVLLLVSYGFWRDIFPDWLRRIGADTGKYLRRFMLCVLLFFVGTGLFHMVHDGSQAPLTLESPFGILRVRQDTKSALWLSCVEECRRRTEDGHCLLEIPGDDLLLAIGQLPSHHHELPELQIGDRGDSIVACLRDDPGIQTVVIVRTPLEFTRFGTEFGVEAARYLRSDWEVYRSLGGCASVAWWDLTRLDQKAAGDDATVYFLRRKGP